MNNLPPLRCEAFNTDLMLYTENTYEDLLLIREKSFERTEDFLQEARRIITFIKNDARPWDYQSFYQRNPASFAFLNQKIDEFYMKESQKLQSLFEKEVWEDLDYAKEKETKSILRDLFKCEMAIEKISNTNSDSYSPNLSLQLEILFDDCELLDLLLLVISTNQLLDWCKDNQPLRLKTLCFISPFLKLFYGGNGDIMDFCKDHQGFLKKSEGMEEVYKDMKTLLSQYTDLSESEILRIFEEIKSINGDRRKLRQIVIKEKHRFKEEKGYYEVLGNLSLLLYLWKQEAAGSEVLVSFLKIGVVCYPFYLDGWKNIKTGFENNQFEYYWRFNTLNLKDGRDLPIRLMKLIVDKVKKTDFNEEYLQLLELDLLAFGSLMKEIPQGGLSSTLDSGLDKEFEGCIDSCLLNSEGDKSFILHDFYEFLDSNMINLSQIQSSYVIESLLNERLISEWIEFYRGMGSWNFVGAESDKRFLYKEKYCSPAKILLKDLIELTTSEKGHFMLVPEPLRDKMAGACANIFRDRNLLRKSELEEVYLSAQDLGIAFLQDLKKGVPIEKKVLIIIFRFLIKISGSLTNKWKAFYESDNPEEDSIKKIYESKLIEELIAAYEENHSLLQKTGDVNVTEAVWGFINLITNFCYTDASFVSKERNSNFLKLVLQDSCEIDFRLVNRQPLYCFSLSIETLLRQGEFVKHLKEEKLLFGLLRLHLFGPCVSSWEWTEFPENFYKIFSGDLMQKKTFLHLFGKFLEVFENKMRNPSVDFDNALREFENGVEDEKKKYQQGEVGEEKTSRPYLADKEASIITERTSISSLQIFAGVYCNRLSRFVEKIPSSFMSDLEKLREQVESITRRFVRMSVDPLIAFTCNPILSRNMKHSFWGISWTDQDIFLCLVEGVFAGIVDICKEFKFNEYSVVSKLDAKRLSKMVTRIASIESVRRDDIPEDISYQEAALISLLIGVKSFNKSFDMLSRNPPKKLERLKNEFKEVTILIDQVRNNVLKCISLEIVNESQDIEAFAKDCKMILDGGCFSLNLWSEIFKTFYGAENLKTPTEEIYKTIIKRFDPISLNEQEEKSNLAGIIENSFWLKEVYPDSDYIPEDLCITLITSPEGLEVLLKLEIYVLECAEHYSDAKTKELVKPMIGYLEACLKGGKMILNNESEVKKNCFEKEEEGKVLFQIIGEFLKKLATRQVLQRNCKGFNYTKEKVTAIEKKIEEVKNKKTEEGSALEEKKEGEAKVEEDPVVELEKFEKEKTTLIDNYKNEIQKYIDAIVQCQQHHMINLKELFALGEEFNSVIPHDYWIKLHENACRNLAMHLVNSVKDSDLKRKLENIKSPDHQINPKDISNYKPINQIYQLDFLYQCLEQLSIKEIVNDLSLNRDLIEGFLMTTEETLKSFVSEDLMRFAKEKECVDFLETTGSLISRVSKIAINSIVSHVLENNGDDRFLLISLDLTESVFAAQQCILHSMKQDIFSGSNSTCFKDMVCLMNAILRANKSLRVEFLNRNILAKLFTVDGLSGMDNDEISSVLFLMMTLLEDSLVLDSQGDLAIKSISQKQESQEISLEDFKNNKNFKPLQNYQRALERLKLEGPKDNNFIANLQRNLSLVAEECLHILLKSLIENYSFEKISMASFEKVKEKEKSKNKDDINNRRRRTKDYLFVRERLQEEEWCSEPNLYWNESFNRQMIVKDTSALVVVLSGILSNHPHLIPSVIFQEVSSIEDILRNDPDLVSFFKSNSRQSIYDILLRLVLLKDGSSAVFMIASLIEDNVVTILKEKQSIELKYVLLIKTFEILEDILDSEENHQTLNSALMRRNIAMIVAFISSHVNKDDSSQYREEIIQLIMQTTQKLFNDPQMIAYSIQDQQPNKSIVQILSNMVRENSSKLMTKEEIKSNYADILNALKTRGPYEPKVFKVDLKQEFDKNLFMMKESQRYLNVEDQKKFEMKEEKSQWEKEETKRLCEIAGLKEKELLSEVRFAAYGDTTLGADLTLNNIFSENAELHGLENLYKPAEILRGKPLKSGGDLKVDYLLERIKASQVLGQIQKEIDQTLGGNIDSDILLPLLKVDLSKIDKLKNDDSKIAQLSLKEQNQDAQSIIQGTKIEEKETTTQEVKVEENSNPVPAEKKEDESTFKYFMDVTVKSESNFRFRVNRALKQGRRLKEMICLEKTLKGSDEKVEEIIQEFSSKMPEFDKNVVYASLGKKFEVGLSEEFLKVTEGTRKELEMIQKDFSQYEEAKNKLPKIEEQKESEQKKEEEDEEYEHLDYDIQFLTADEGKQETEKKKEDAEDEKEEETNELIGEEGVKPETAPAETENKNEKIMRLINSFEVDDNFIMNALELLFCYINPNSGNQNLVIEFLKDSLSLNPVTELKILDVLITILYTPDFFQHLNRKLACSYEQVVEIILNYISKYFEDASRSYIFFVPKGYLEKFGVTLLKDLKETTGFGRRISDCHTLLEMLLGLIEDESFCSNKQWILKILEGVSLLFKNERKIKLSESAPQGSMDRYRKLISSRKLLNLLNMIENSTNQDSSEMKLKIQELFINMKSIPELFVPFQDHLSNHFYQIILKLNKEIENTIRLFKEIQSKDLEATEIHDILAPLNLSQFQLIMTIMFSFASVFHSNLFTEEGKKSKASKKLRALLGTVTETLFNEEEVKAFFVNLHELAELLNKVQLPDSFHELFNLLIMICIGHYSIIIMEGSVEEENVELRKQSEGSILSADDDDEQQTPILARLVSYEDQNTHEMIPLQKSYSYYRREVNVDFGAIFANFALKHCSRISKIALSPMTGIITVLSNLISITIQKFPWIMDFKSKMKLFESKVNDQLTTNKIDDNDRRHLQIDRKSLAFSAMKEFKDRPMKELLQFISISYKEESGIDGGGLRRDFYEVITKQLFDPFVGLFKLASNQLSIQPNPMSGMIPYDSTLMQFAGLILAKAICEKMVVNLNFTKPFLKHLLGKKLTIADMEGVDADLGKNLRWILENNIEELYLTYTHEVEVLGERTVIELKNGGADLSVEEEHKKEYVKQICEYRMTRQIERQLKNFLKGFRMILPRDFISHFTTSELEILIAGESKIDLEEMKKHVKLNDHNPSDQIIIWLWEVLGEFSQDQLTSFLYFVSGSTKVPFGGFKENPIRISSNSNKDGLPVAHTCSYVIEIPNYDSKDKLREKLLLAIFDGVGEFLIA